MEEKLSLQEWIKLATQDHQSFGDFCIAAQVKQLEIEEAVLMGRMEEMLQVMQQSIEMGLTGVKSMGGLVGGNGKKIESYREAFADKSIVGSAMSKAIMIALAVGEANASMGRIVAVPTAGASGTLPAVLFSLAEARNFSMAELAKALVVAGAIGMVIASRASLSGAEGGCQAECGSAAAMAAGAAVELYGGTPNQVGQAVAMTLKNMLGLVCDPVAGLVEVPCVKRNAGAAAQAMVAAEMALAGVESVIPVDEVIDAMASVGNSMSCSLKETAQGGLAVSPTGLAWAEKLFAK
ncbi:L-serine ammonia-lyase, iron-sulfur-dependent, subunit alpha [Pelosinus sp. IPA-1]|uniref:L-serine ammonia-lyase, iron-sulfur-dependent, subunit alpha n=1 Tax=Pelosinus sp. IPA-1 TaxID=3029569 RepID=UPI0024361679|nr:L-serine ammonia-lyase, iron-sulfur-dependent, subunit alpha [Pelosinus sp. IPA-1]GMB00766.1 L-serine dehydratase, iron-sulfur-dependent subunit alpha [Pelosinus sp. IPA-1]